MPFLCCNRSHDSSEQGLNAQNRNSRESYCISNRQQTNKSTLKLHLLTSFLYHERASLSSIHIHSFVPQANKQAPKPTQSQHQHQKAQYPHLTHMQATSPPPGGSISYGQQTTMITPTALYTVCPAQTATTNTFLSAT